MTLYSVMPRRVKNKVLNVDILLLEEKPFVQFMSRALTVQLHISCITRTNKLSKL